MSTDPTNNPSSNNQVQEQASPREQRRAEHRANHGGAWIGGAVMIVLGVIFLLQNMGMPMLDNWWAVFILIPAFGSFSAAWNMYHNRGSQATGAVISSIVLGVFLTVLALTFFFDLDLSKIGPIALILLGVGVLTGTLVRPTQ